MKMEQTVCSEMSAHKIQTSGNHSKEGIQHSVQGESLKSITLYFDVFLTVHHNMDLLHLPTLMHNSFIH
jgi:hypothetical protein